LIGAALQSLPTIAASATAATNPMEMRALGFLLGLHGLRDFWSWAEAHGCYKNQWDGWEWGGADEDIAAIHRQVFPSKGIRVRISDLGDAFPKTQIRTELIPVSSPDKIDKAYAAVTKAISEVHEKARTDDSGAEHLTAQLRARQVSELQKIPALIELAKDAIAERRSVFIGVNFSDSIDAVRASLKDVPCSIIRGDQTADERQRNIDAFQADKTRVVIANLRAGGVGVSLHDLNGRYPRTALICPGWSPTDLKQALGRVWRAGGKSTSIQRILYAADTVEEKVAERIEERLRTLAILNDGIDFNLTDKDLEP
jgi:SNF2 family DNA or RNA helicase